MTTAHLSENELQQYAINSNDVAATTAEHIRVCEQCRLKASNYKALFTEMKAIPKPVFDFDVAALVLAQLPAKKQPFSRTTVLISCLVVMAAAIPISLFWGYIIQVFKGISVILLLLIVISAACVLLFQYIEIFNNHKKQMNALKFH